jgi:hypothetical protein
VILQLAMTQIKSEDVIRREAGAMSLSDGRGPEEGSRNMICRW